MKVIFSPHMDDAFISLGGSILNWVKKGEKVRIIDVFTISCRTNRGFGDSKSISKIRKAEEKKVARKTRVKVKFLDFVDSNIRGYKFPFNSYPKAINWKKDKNLFEKLKKAIKSELNNEDEFFFPFGRAHADHRIVRLAALKVIKKEYKFAFYEDMPYAELFKLPKLKLKLRPKKEKIKLNKKLELVRAYESQISPSWLLIIKKHAKKLNNCERYWQCTR